MRLNDAIKRATEAAEKLEGQDAAAVLALVSMCRRVHRLAPEIKRVSDALVPKGDHLNQLDLLGDA